MAKSFFCIDLSKYRLIIIFWNSLPMIFKGTGNYEKHGYGIGFLSNMRGIDRRCCTFGLLHNAFSHCLYVVVHLVKYCTFSQFITCAVHLVNCAAHLIKCALQLFEIVVYAYLA